MFNFIIHLLVLSSIVSLSAGETLTEFHVNETLPKHFLDYPCPNGADIAPCVCDYDLGSNRLTLDCTDISSDDELANILAKDFPVTDFYEFQMDNSASLTALNFPCGGVKFRRYNLSPGPFQSLVEVSDDFYDSCSNTELESVFFKDTQLASVVFPPSPLSDKITDFRMPVSYLASVPPIKSTSLSYLDIGDAQISQITPGTFDEITNLRDLYLFFNDIKVLEKGSIPITSDGYSYNFYNCGLERIDPGAFFLKGEPTLNSLFIYLPGNLLKTIDASVFEVLMPYIYILYIQGNPLDCGCDLAWIITNPEYMYKVAYYGTAPTCANGTLLTDLDPAQFVQNCY